MPFRSGLFVGLVLALMAATVAVAAPARAGDSALLVRHPSTGDAKDLRAVYPVAVLRLALEKAGVSAEIVPATVPMEQARAIRALAAGQLIDVMWTVSTPERERELLPIRVPIDRGLIGWRVLLVERSALPRFRSITRAGELAVLRGAQGHDWPDLPILRANGLDVLASPHYESLFELLARGRIDYVPRGISEARPEAAAHADKGLVIEPTLLLHYPSALYFFVHPDNASLAEQIDRGLRLAHEDGSLTALLDQAYGEDIAALHLPRRTRIELVNPLLPPETPLSHPGWWFTPEPSR
mgnify:CR=1 FL=1